jgi:hypothetical protein
MKHNKTLKLLSVLPNPAGLHAQMHGPAAKKITLSLF